MPTEYFHLDVPSDAGRDWGQEQKGKTEDKMAGWHHRLNGCEFEIKLRKSHILPTHAFTQTVHLLFQL